MKDRHTMAFVSSDGRRMLLDLCSFCRKIKDLRQSGDCDFYNEYENTTCPGFEKVPDITHRIDALLNCRCQKKQKYGETGKQCLCIYTQAKPPISAPAETSVSVLVGALPQSPQITAKCDLERRINPAAARFCKSL